MFNKKEKIVNMCFWITAFIFAGIFFCYFLNTITDVRLRDFDYYAHFEHSVEGGARAFDEYNLVDLIIYLLSPLGRTFNLILYCLILAVSKISVVFIVKWYLQNANEIFKSNWKVDLICFSLLFVVGLIPVWHWATGYMYIGYCSPNIWHNPTIVCLIPFALLSLIYIEKCYFQNDLTKRNWILLCVFLTLGTFAKPSFLIGIIPALGLMMVVDLFRQKWKNLKTVLYMMMAFVPSVLIVIFQYFILFGSDSTSGIILSTGQLPILTIPLLILTPALIYIFNVKRISKLDILCMIFYVVSFLIGFFITETGARAEHGNFGWSYLCAVSLLYILSFIRYVTYSAEMGKYQRIIVNISLLLNIICGITYFFRVWIVGNYY